MPIAYGQTATDPTTGHRIVLTPQGWVALNTQQMDVPKTDDKAIQDLQQQTQDAQYLDQKAQQFINKMDPHAPGQGSFATGPIYGGGIPIPFAHGAEIPNPIPTIVGRFDPRMGGLESISNQAWVHMRPSGSGAIRGYEASDFKDAFPNVTHWGGENQDIANQLHQDALIATQKLAFIDHFIRSGQGDYAQANQAWQSAFASPGASAAPQPQPAQAAPQGGPPAIPPPMQMVPNAQSPIGYVPAPGASVPQNPTPQQAAILNWTPDKGLHP